MEDIRRHIHIERQSTIKKRVEATEGPMPPEVRISPVSSDGRVFLIFTNEMILPYNFTELLNVSNETDVLTVISKAYVKNNHLGDLLWYIDENVPPQDLLQLVMLR